MSLKELQAGWTSRFPRLNDRVKTHLLRNFSDIECATTEAEMLAATLLSKGYVYGLLDAELVNEAGAHVLETILYELHRDSAFRLRDLKRQQATLDATPK